MRKCPVDDFTLSWESYEGVTIDRYSHCQGVWLDEGELEVVQENQDDDFRDVSLSKLSKATAAIDMAKSDVEKTRHCVTCETGLVKRECSFGSQVMIDNCPNGHGVWLDKAELSCLQAFYEGEQDFANIAEVEILRELRLGGIKNLFRNLINSFKP